MRQLLVPPDKDAARRHTLKPIRTEREVGVQGSLTSAFLNFRFTETGNVQVTAGRVDFTLTRKEFIEMLLGPLMDTYHATQPDIECAHCRKIGKFPEAQVVTDASEVVPVGSDTWPQYNVCSKACADAWFKRRSYRGSHPMDVDCRCSTCKLQVTKSTVSVHVYSPRCACNLCCAEAERREAERVGKGKGRQ